MIKTVFARADEIEYQFEGLKNKRESRTTVLSIPLLEEEMVLFFGILNKNVNVDYPLNELETSNQDGEKFNI